MSSPSAGVFYCLLSLCFALVLILYLNEILKKEIIIIIGIKDISISVLGDHVSLLT
jgi:hypothetical protein